MSEYTLEFLLLSDTTLGSGRGLAGVVDIEVEHDALGLPFLNGRGVKGLLKAAFDDLSAMPGLASLFSGSGKMAYTGTTLLGTTANTGLLHVGPACIGDDQLRKALRQKNWPATQVLEAFTSIRRQTSIDAETGAAEENTLRGMRVLTRGLRLRSCLVTDSTLNDDQKALLGALVSAIRHIGTRRNRGLGLVQVDILDADKLGSVLTPHWLDLFARQVQA